MKKYKFSTIKNVKLKQECKIPNKINKIRNYIVMDAISGTTYGNWAVDFDCLTCFMDFDSIKKYSEDIKTELYGHPAILDVEVYDDCFDIILSTMYFDNPWEYED